MMPTDYIPRPKRLPPAFPQPLAAAAFAGPAGDAVRLLSPHSEADPAALLLRLLSAFGATVGRSPHVRIGGVRHGPVLWPVFVGGTSAGRKGQSWGDARHLLSLADDSFAANNIRSGLTTGQGLVHAIRDAVRGKPINKAQKMEADCNEDGLCELDTGVADKRLLVREAELAKVLAAAAREGNNLSATLRDAWDGSDLREMTRTNPYGATAPHVIVQADVTPAELRAMLTANDAANGFANRFLFVATKQSKLLPFGGDLDDDDLRPVAEQLRRAASVASEVQRMTWTDAARPVWADLYASVHRNDADADDNAMAMLTARAAPHLLRLSVTYALLDEKDAIGPRHIDAAAAVWAYCRDSAAWAFGLAAAAVDPLAERADRIAADFAGVVSVRDWQNARGRACPSKAAARGELAELAEAGYGTLDLDPVPAGGGRQSETLRLSTIDNRPDSGPSGGRLSIVDASAVGESPTAAAADAADTTPDDYAEQERQAIQSEGRTARDAAPPAEPPPPADRRTQAATLAIALNATDSGQRTPTGEATMFAHPSDGPPADRVGLPDAGRGDGPNGGRR